MRIPTALRRKRWLYLSIVVLWIGAFFWLREGKLTIAITRGVEGAVLKTVAQDFATATGISVEIVEYSYDGLYDSVIEQLQKNESRFDVILVDDPWLPALVGKSEHPRLQRLIFSREECDELVIGDFVAACIYVCRLEYSVKEVTCPDSEASNERLHALPFVGNSQLFVRDIREVPQNPSSWDEVFAPTKQSGYVLRVGGGNRIVTDFMPLLWAAAPEDFTPAGVPRLSERALRAFGWLKSLGESPIAKRSIVSYDDFDLAIYLIHKKASAAIVWSAWAMAFAKLPDHKVSQGLEFDLVPGRPALGSWLLSIPANLNASRAQMAKRFILFALDQERMIDEARQGNPPVRWSVLENPDLVEFFPSFKAQMTSLKNARPRPRTDRWRDVEKVLGEQLSDLYEQRVSPDAALRNADNALREINSGRSN